MDFCFTVEDYIHISDDELNEMAEEVKNGNSVESALYNYLLGRGEYYQEVSNCFKYQVYKEIKKRAGGC